VPQGLKPAFIWGLYAALKRCSSTVLHAFVCFYSALDRLVGEPRSFSMATRGGDVELGSLRLLDSRGGRPHMGWDGFPDVVTVSGISRAGAPAPRSHLVSKGCGLEWLVGQGVRSLPGAVLRLRAHSYSEPWESERRGI
jgi:hypothetical protein